MPKELEIKILDVSPVDMEKKLQALGCEKTIDTIQKLYVFDVQTIRGSYQSILADWNDKSVGMNDVVLNRTKQLLLELNSIISAEDNEKICNLLKTDSIVSAISSVRHSQEFFTLLKSSEFSDVISRYGVASKWIRLIQTGDKTTLTVKHILENPQISDGILQYGLSSVEETELAVESIEKGKEFLQSLGFYYRNYQEKKRVSYVYKPMSLEIEIDSWPLIPPYLEIEGKSEKEIYDFVKMLGYSEDDVKIANTCAVYKMYGKNIHDYKELRFEKE